MDMKNNKYILYWVVVPLLILLAFFIVFGFDKCEYTTAQSGEVLKDCGQGWQRIESAEW